MQVDSSSGNESHDDWKIVHALSSTLNLVQVNKAMDLFLNSFESAISIPKGGDNKSLYRDCLNYFQNNLTYLNNNGKSIPDSNLGFKSNKKEGSAINHKKAFEILNYGSDLYRLTSPAESKPINSVFENIAPHLDNFDDISVSSPYKASLGDSGKTVESSFTKDLSKSFSFEDSNFIPLFDNFYQTDVISKASVSMGKSSLSFKNQAWPF
jgi:hypothetical protein